MKITLPYEWKARPYQERLWNYLYEGGKRAVARWHRRSGKDEVFLHHTCVSAFRRPGNYWYMLPEYGQARKSMWDAINPHSGKKRIDEVFPKEIRTGFNEQEMKIGLGGKSVFQLVGSDNFNSLVGSPPVGLVFSEYALSDPSAWGYLRPILLENGGWAGFNSTPRGPNHFKAICEHAERDSEWFYETLTNDDTGVFTQEQMDSELAELQALHGEEHGRSIWMQEYFVSFDAAIPGAIWADCLDRLQLRGGIGVVPVDPAFPVSTGWDLGRTDDTAIWFYQFVNGEIHVVDYHASNLKEIEFYAELLRQWRKTHGIKWGTHWVPHDARPRRLGMGGKSILQQFIAHDVGRFVVAPRLDRQEGIQAARATFPRCRFDAVRCEKGLEALRNYHREWDEEKRMFSDNPEHDWSSHCADAFRTLALSWRPPPKERPDAPIEEIRSSNVIPGSFGELKRRHFQRMAAQKSMRI